MKKVLVTGAGGQLGRSLRDAIGAFDDLRGIFLDRKALDICDSDALEKAFQQYSPDYCVNCAAYTDVEGAEKDPNSAMQVNAFGVEMLAKCCSRHDTILIHISTDYVFDGTQAGGYYPSDPPNPINAYGRSKLEGERRIAANLKRFFILRTSWLYAINYGPNFYRTILAKARKGASLEVTDQQVGCPTRADHLAGFILQIIREGRSDYGILHFTDGEAMSWYDFARKILKEEGLLESVKLLRAENYRTLAERPKSSILKA